MSDGTNNLDFCRKMLQVLNRAWFLLHYIVTNVNIRSSNVFHGELYFRQAWDFAKAPSFLRSLFSNIQKSDFHPCRPTYHLILVKALFLVIKIRDSYIRSISNAHYSKMDCFLHDRPKVSIIQQYLTSWGFSFSSVILNDFFTFGCNGLIPLLLSGRAFHEHATF